MTRLTLWAGTVAQSSFAERLDAAASCGYSGMSVTLLDVVDNPHRMHQLASRAGIELVALESMVNWLPDWTPPSDGSVDRTRIKFMSELGRFDADRILDMAAALGCSAISVIEPYGRPLPVEQGAEAFARMCDRASDRDLVLQLEAMPFSGIPDLTAAQRILARAGKSNSGLMLDTWHLFRSGGDAAVLETVQLSNMSVQLSDAPGSPASDLWTEALDARLLPAEGDTDLPGVVETLRRRGFSGAIGPEVISVTMRSLEPKEAARRAASASRALLDPDEA